MNRVTVYKLDEQGREVWQYPARVLERREDSIRLEAYFDRGEVDIGPVVLERGDRFVETFYSQRWYNVFAVYGRATGKLKGWYCNVSRPAEIADDTVRCDDLALDVWVSARGETTTLDEDEFGALSLSPRERELSRAALSHIVSLGQKAQLPT